MAVFEILHEVGIPAGVVNLVTALDPAPIGEVFCTHPEVKTDIYRLHCRGKSWRRPPRRRLKRVSMELGGTRPSLCSTMPTRSTPPGGGALVKFLNTGQACISPNRIFVQRKILAPFLDTLRSASAAGG